MEKLKKEAKEKRRQRKKDKYKYDTSSLKKNFLNYFYR